MSLTIYNAKKILTLDPAQPLATHVAVRDGRILGAGMLEELTGWGEYRLDESFATKVLMPGLVEGHSHVTEGTYWRYAYVGFFDRTDPDGKVWKGAGSIAAVVERLRDAEAKLTGKPDPLTAWALDPIYFEDKRRCSRQDLDQVSRSRAVGVMHASGHILNVNSKALELAGLLRKGVEHPGIPLGDDGLPTGEMKGPDPMTLVGAHVGLDRNLLACDELGLRLFARAAVRKGVTTAADMASLLPPAAVDMMLRVTGEADFPLRVVSLRRMQDLPPAQLVARAHELRAVSTDQLRLGILKIVVDGSIQGFSARLSWPGYYNGAPNGLWYVAPEELAAVLALALEHDVQVHLHTNGDEATSLVLDTLGDALAKYPRRDHRFTIQHGQLATPAQFRRMAQLGLCVNLFPNHIYYWGDQHHAVTVGPERAQRMNACASALAAGVPLAIHSDAPVTPLGPLFTAWCAVNRRSASGRILGAAERIDVAQALRTITLGAAYTLKLDHEIGSIACGKRADFAVLEDDPMEIGAERLKDVRIWGTVQGGRVFPAGAA
jgi:predicted amidohydrolase YtcJ